MRLGRKYLTDHVWIGGQTANDHHNQGISQPITVNGTNIGAFATYPLTIPLGRAGFMLVRAVLRGTVNVSNQGQTGAIVMATTSATFSSAWSESYSGYTYMGVHSRLHGDTRLSYTEFGTDIYLKDAYISGSDCIFLFQNGGSGTRTLICYGLLVAK